MPSDTCHGLPCVRNRADYRTYSQHPCHPFFLTLSLLKHPFFRRKCTSGHSPSFHFFCPDTWRPWSR